MKSDKQLKKELKQKASLDPDSYYSTTVLKNEGFHRSQCQKCDLYFWSTNQQRTVCGDSSCIGEFSVANNNLCKKQLSYIDVWNKFKEHFQKRNYQPINRYPVVARWNPTVDFTIASIAAFQPFVITGEIDPPAKRLVIPQFCLRFGDIDNVGITGSHCTGFVMIGQHQFVPEDEWDQDQAFIDIYEFLTQVIGLDKNELTLHEDAWAGAGNFGPCMEFFAAGLELFNQVYMMYEQQSNGETKDLKLKVLDMGLGMERIAWFSQGTANLYEAIFPETLKKVKDRTNAEYDTKLFSKFSKFAGRLNIDEVEDINQAWDDVATELKIKDGQTLKQQILPMVAVYAITEHTRALLVALNDGQLPSNSGGGYNLRAILRRALSFIDQFGWTENICLEEIANWHAQELKDFYPELMQNIEQVIMILDNEKVKFADSKKNAYSILKNIDLKSLDTDKLIELYDSNGITPELVKEYANKQDIKIKIPDNFYNLVAELQEKRSLKNYEKKAIDEYNLYDADEKMFSKIPETEVLYYGDWNIRYFESKVIMVQGKVVILEKTHFYPTSGGQEHDEGIIGGIKVKVLGRIGKHILHILEEDAPFGSGEIVKCEIDIDRRKQLAQHHTSAHIVGAAARLVLGEHINQAGAHKKVKNAHLDITHFKALTKKEVGNIQKKANEIVKSGISISKFFMPRGDAEQKFGVRIYQGGVAPGKNLRIVDIAGVDVQACGGTHLNNTSEAEQILITGSTKISDSVVRITYVAGLAAESLEAKGSEGITDAIKLLNCKREELTSYSRELFSLWKKGRKAAKKGKEFDPTLSVENPEIFDGSDSELLEKVAEVFRVQPEHVSKTIQRFQEEIEGFANK